jgi:3-deoxy-D-manno-octulosonic-acid transferase
MSEEPRGIWPWLGYNAALGALMPVWGPYMAWRLAFGKSRPGRAQRLGFGPALPRARDRVWMHGASVGEMHALRPVAERFHARRPLAPVVVSTVTETGQEAARASYPWAEQVRYAPLDVPGAVARSVNAVGASVVALVETELWPNFLHAAAMRGRVVMINGRISDRTLGPARRFPGLYAWMLSHIDLLGMQTRQDADRVIALGADPGRVRVLGTSKFDEEVPLLNDAQRAEWRKTLGLGAHRVLIAGSTFPGEDEVAIAAFLAARARVPGLRLLIAPRHIERAPDVARAAEAAGLRAARRSIGDAADAEVLIVDTFGELAALYGLADVAFIGKSLAEHGGQNLIQPMAHGVPVVYGPNMENFRDVAEQAEAAGAAIRVPDATALAETIDALWTTDAARRTMGEAGKRLVAANRGASARYADLIIEALDR